ncbi:DNA polymerase Y family protein [Halorubrum pallidum]
MGGETLPGTAAAADDDGSDRVVCHVDMDCFYASCERLRRPELADEPVVVGMGYEDGETVGAVATASYEARAFGVESAMPISEALERLPRRADADPDDPDAPGPEETGRYLPVDLDFYADVAGEVKEVIRDCADTRREVSIDEAYLDVTDRTSWAVAGGESESDTGDDDGDSGEVAGDGNGGGVAGDSGPPPSAAAGPADARTLAEGYARHVKSRIEREAGVPASVGVAPNMSAAKVASDADKPDGLVVVPPGSVADFLAPLPTADVHGVGPVTERTLADMGIETAGDLAAADPDRLDAELGDRGRALYRRARGDDDRDVTPTGLPKSLSRESSLPATADDETKRETVSALAADVARRARERGCLYRTIGIKAVEPPFEVNTRARSLPGPVDDPDLVEEVALDLLGEFAEVRVRKLGVRVSKLDFAESDQATLSGFETAARSDDGASESTAFRSTAESDGSKLTEWVGAEPTDEERGDGGSASRPRGVEEEQASLSDWD